jgi:hypothetical protein
MSWMERLQNLFIMGIEAFEGFALSGYDSMYREHFGNDFPSAE